MSVVLFVGLGRVGLRSLRLFRELVQGPQVLLDGED